MKTKTKIPKEKLERNYDKYKNELEKLEKKYNGYLSPNDIVREASKKESPLNDWFDWNKDVASEKWLLHQARLLMNSVKVRVTFEEGMKQYRKYLNVKVEVDDNGKKFKRFYVDTERVLKNPDYKSQILARAIKEIDYWQRCYEDYQELEDIFKGVKRTKKKLKKILVTNNV